jgi:hypothetical protein
MAARRSRETSKWLATLFRELAEGLNDATREPALNRDTFWSAWSETRDQFRARPPRAPRAIEVGSTVNVPPAELAGLAVKWGREVPPIVTVLQQDAGFTMRAKVTNSGLLGYEHPPGAELRAKIALIIDAAMKSGRAAVSLLNRLRRCDYDHCGAFLCDPHTNPNKVARCVKHRRLAKRQRDLAQMRGVREREREEALHQGLYARPRKCRSPELASAKGMRARRSILIADYKLHPPELDRVLEGEVRRLSARQKRGANRVM